MGIARQQHPIMMVHANRGTLPECDRGKEFLDFCRRDGPRNDAKKLAVWTGHLAGEEQFPLCGEAAKYQFDLERRRLRVKLEGFEICAIVDPHIRNRRDFR